MYRLSAIFLTLLSVCSITGCTTTLSTGTAELPISYAALRDKNIALPTAARREIQGLLAEANRATNPKTTEARITAAQLAARYQQAPLLRNILDAITTPFINDITSRNYILLRTRLALIERDPALALSWLAHKRLPLPPRSSPSSPIEPGYLSADAWLFMNNHLASATALIAINPLLSNQARSTNQQTILTRLLQLPPETLSRQAEQSKASDLRGWLSLAAIRRGYQDNPEQQLATLKAWRKVWLNHAAISMLPEMLAQLTRIIEEGPKKIALILPLQDEQLGVYGRAIRDGFIAGYYFEKGAHKGSQKGSQKNQAPRLDSVIKVFDSSQADIIDLVKRAKSEGAEMIIGPLERDKITQLARQKLDIPVMALNRTDRKARSRNFYQFGLAPEDESIQLAEQIYDTGLLRGLIIAPDTDWGQRNVDAFSERFLALGGLLIDTARFTSQRDYSELVKSLLNIDLSELRAQTLHQVTNQSFQFKARRRQDIDFVLLLANHVQAKGINPTLAYFYAEDVPVYATSHVHELSTSRIDTIDLKGIKFCDIPWKLTTIDPVQRIIQETWPAAATRLARFYALGLDAYRLYPRLEVAGASTHIFGATGVLELNSDNVIQRRLSWGKFKDGTVVVAPRYEMTAPRP